MRNRTHPRSGAPARLVIGLAALMLAASPLSAQDVLGTPPVGASGDGGGLGLSTQDVTGVTQEPDPAPAQAAPAQSSSPFGGFGSWLGEKAQQVQQGFGQLQEYNQKVVPLQELMQSNGGELSFGLRPNEQGYHEVSGFLPLSRTGQVIQGVQQQGLFPDAQQVLQQAGGYAPKIAKAFPTGRVNFEGWYDPATQQMNAFSAAVNGQAPALQAGQFQGFVPRRDANQALANVMPATTTRPFYVNQNGRRMIRQDTRGTPQLNAQGQLVIPTGRKQWTTDRKPTGITSSATLTLTPGQVTGSGQQFGVGFQSNPRVWTNRGLLGGIATKQAWQGYYQQGRGQAFRDVTSALQDDLGGQNVRFGTGFRGSTLVGRGSMTLPVPGQVRFGSQGVTFQGDMPQAGGNQPLP